MTTNELRTGNLIMFNNPVEPKRIVTVNARFFSSIAAGRTSDEIKNDEEINGYYSGIPLTKDWLRRCGYADDGLMSNRLILDLGDSDSHLTLPNSEGKVNISDYAEWLVIPYSLLYVHQLQNLYFALTQKELIIYLTDKNLQYDK